MKASFRKILGALAVALATAAPAFASPVISWVPPRGLDGVKKLFDSTWTYDGKEYGIKDGLTYLNLQWWKPDTAGNLKPKSVVSDANIRWFVDWGKANGVKVQFCIYNSPDGGESKWNWAAVRAVIKGSKRDPFISKMLKVVDDYDMDGMDIDFECNEDPDPEACNADLGDYTEFMRVLRDSLHKRNKTLTYASFSDEWNGPNTAWWSTLDTIVDAWASMGYDDDGYKKEYPEQISFVPERSLHKFAVGVPSLDTWKSYPADDHLSWLLNTGKVGFALWDIRLLDYTDDDNNPPPSYWRTGRPWYLAKLMKEQNTGKVDVVEGEQVQNNTFSGTADWNVRAKNGATIDTTTDESGLHVTIGATGTDALAISVSQHDMTLVAGEKYTFAFCMSASQDASVLAVVGLGSSPYTQYSSHTIDATGDLTVYEYTFTASETTTDARVVFEVSADAGTTFGIQAVSMAHGETSLLPDYTPPSTGLGDKAFERPGFRTAATVYGITGRALLALPAQDWSSAEQLREAIRGQLPSGVYLVKFDGATKTAKVSIDR